MAERLNALGRALKEYEEISNTITISEFIFGYAAGYGKRYAKTKTENETKPDLYEKYFKEGTYEGLMKAITYVINQRRFTLESVLGYIYAYTKIEISAEEYNRWKDKKGDDNNAL